jgi:undecaprenyl diphosphate synthase
MNTCLSCGSRGEIVAAAQAIAKDVLLGKIKHPKISITKNTFADRLLTRHCGGDPDVLIWTSGEVLISNFMLWQLAYTEMFFVEKPWPALDKDDLLHVIRTCAQGRNRRYGK